MKIVYAGIRNENYDPRRRESFEYRNFYLTLRAMPGVEVIEHPFGRILEVGKKIYNEELVALVRQEKPDLFFAFMYTDELDMQALDEIKKITTSIAWFADDYWRFFNYSRHWPSHFSHVVTTYAQAVAWYQASGHKNVILSQWACNTADYKPLDLRQDIDMSFVGQRKSGREKVLDALQAAQIHVSRYGFGFPNGKISHEKMLEIFSRSKISLNLADRASLWEPQVLARLVARKSISRVVPDFHLLDNFRALQHYPTLHIHARPFELSGCGAFVLSTYVPGIENYYTPDREMVFYKTPEELIEKARYYLDHSEEREKIARAGYERTRAEHTYEKRFAEVFERIGVR